MEWVRIRGARENNLADVDLDLPLGKLVVFCGVSGSGKSSLAFETIHREAQRRYLEAMTRAGVPIPRPDVESIQGLPPTIALDQRERSIVGSRSVAAVSGIEVPLSVLFARTGTQYCPVCDRPIVPRTYEGMVGELMALPEGGRLHLEAPVSGEGAVIEEIQRAGFSRVRVGEDVVRLEDYRPSDLPVRIVVDRLKIRPDRRDRMLEAIRLTARAGAGVVVGVHDAGVMTFVDRPLCVHDGTELARLEPSRLRLGDTTRPGRLALGEVDWTTVGQTPVGELLSMLDGVERNPVRDRVIADVRHRADALIDLGLGELPLGRPMADVSRGERLRIRLARQVSNRTRGVLYVMDEPAAGLDEGAAQLVTRTLERLVEQGNSVLAVGHHPTLLRAADTLVEFGPGAGPKGGHIVFEGPVTELVDTATATVLSGDLQPHPPRGPGSADPIGGVPVQQAGITVLTGPSGSGKSRALAGVVGSATLERVIHATADPIGRSSRSMVATYVGFWSVMRELLAETRESKLKGFTRTTFSLNTKGGRCETCGGMGQVKTVLDPLPPVFERCGVCDGRRFQSDVLGVRWRGHAADQLLDLDVDAAHPLLAGHPKLERVLRAMKGASLGHLQLGRSADSLSGGEMRRVRLARELARSNAPDLVAADEPSLGLHPVDTVALMQTFRTLADSGTRVVLASVDPYVVGSADLVISAESFP